jgi:uncharacterized protein YjgD (DUF1641 family)
MAEPIPFPPPPRDPRAALIRQLENAPMDHAEALLDAYAILQLLRDKGLLEIAKGALGSGEKILDLLTETIDSREFVRAVRNLVILGKIAGSLDPVVLEKIVAAVSGSVSEARTQKPPGLLHLLGTLAGPDSRRALGPIVTALASLGATLDESKNPPAGLPKKTVTRHTVID